MTRTPIWWTIRAFATLVAFWVLLVPLGLAQTPAPEKRLAALLRSQFEQPVHREAADTGFRFLRDQVGAATGLRSMQHQFRSAFQSPPGGAHEGTMH